MSITWYLPALAFCCISLLASTTASGELAGPVARAAELEAGLASTRDVYFVAAAEGGTIAIRVRGVTLESFPVESVTAWERRRFVGGGGSATLEVPRIFTVAATISLVDRNVVAPATLKPWSEEAESAWQAAADDARPLAPSSYDVPLEGGWTLEIRQEAAGASLPGRFFAAVADGWAQLNGSGRRDPRPTIRLVMDEGAAGKLHHLFKKGTALLLVTSDQPYQPDE